jgi:hypothetical protein
VFDEAGVALPTSVAGLVELGKSIDFTTKEGLNLAAVFPNLVQAFTETKNIIDELTASTRQGAENFRTFADYTFYEGVAQNYGTEFANDYLANMQAGRIVTNAQGKSEIASDPNLVVADELMKLRKVTEQSMFNSEDMVALLRRFEVLGIKERVDA